jgi:hypothetical protein
MIDKRRYKRRRERYSRLQWSCRRLCNRAVAWGVLSYAFIAVYGALYESAPGMVHRLGMTLAVLCAGGAVLFFGLFVVWKLVEVVTAWRYRHRRSGYG